ncbi:MAG: hypothetical protein LPK92_04395 [Actinomycetes bacterium]|nr:hypothetical protein [Actinomycetes bacterium]
MALVMLPVLIPGVGTADTPSDDSMPGLGSFIVFAFMAVALYFLLKNMNARLRRMSYREKERQEAEAQRQEAQSPEGAEEDAVTRREAGATEAADGTATPEDDGPRP